MKKSLGPKLAFYPTPVLIIGTYDSDGRPDLMTAAWGGVCCSDPPCVAVSVRQKARHTYGNLLRKKEFTISIPSQKYVAEADFFGLVSGAKVDKFKASGLTAVKADSVDAPYVAEFPVVLECRVLQTHDLGVHTQFIGQVLETKAEEDCLDESGRLSALRIMPCIFGPEEGRYYALGAELGPAFQIGRKLKDAAE